MTANRRKSKISGDDGAVHAAPRRRKLAFSPQSAAIVGFLTVWLVLWLSQTLYNAGEQDQTHPRWHLLFAVFFLPDEVFSGWTDGIVSFQGIIDRLRVVMVAAFVALPCWLLGCQLLLKTGIRRHAGAVETAMLGLALGMSLHATATLLLGLAGVVSHPLAMPLLASGELAVAMLLVGRDRSRTAVDAAPTTERRRFRFRPHGLPATLAFIGMLLVAARCLIPAHEFDVLEYHLGAPKEWYQAGQIGFAAHNIYANMPMAAEMQTLSAMSWAGALGLTDAWWWGGLAGKSMMFLYWGLTIGLSGCLVRRFAGPDAAWWLVAVGASGTALAEVTVLGLIEAAVACYFAAALLMLSIMRRHLAVTPTAMLWIGVFAGSAFACKYPALLFVCVPVGLLAAYSALRPAAGIPIGGRTIALFLLGCLLTAGPWLAKNTVLARNPVYPLAAGYLGGYKFSEQKMAQWQSAHAVPTRAIDAFGEAMMQIALSWRSQGAATIPLALIGLFALKRSIIVRIALAIAIYTLAVWWLLTHHLERFLLPAIPVVLVLAGFGIRELFQRVGTRFSAAALTIGVACNLILIAVSPTMGDARLLVDTGEIRREATQASESPRIAEHVLWANQHLQHPETLLLLVGDAAVFNYEVPLLYSTCFDQSQLAVIAQYPPDQWAAQFQRRGITHVMIHWGEIERYRSQGNYGFDPLITRGLIQQMVDQGVLKAIDTGLDPAHVQVFRTAKQPD